MFSAVIVSNQQWKGREKEGCFLFSSRPNTQGKCQVVAVSCGILSFAAYEIVLLSGPGSNGKILN